MLSVTLGFDGAFHVHRRGCRDIAKVRGERPFHLPVMTREELALDLWGDVVADHASGEEHRLLCLEYLDSETKIYPCVTLKES